MLNVLRSFLGAETSPTKVQEVKAETYSSRNISTREDGLVLYKPHSTSSRIDKSLFEIILHKPYSNSAFSIFRSEREDEAQLRFINLKDKLPVLVDIAPSMFNTQNLQKVCDVIQEYPSWSLAHLAAHFSLYEAFSNPKVKNHLNEADPITGQSPLQVAIRTTSVKAVQTLVNLNCSLNHLDYDSNSVFHFAASSTKDIISALAHEKPPPCLNSRNKNGYTPLHLACLADKPECVKALLLAGADVNLKALNGPESGDVSSSTPGYVGAFLKDNANTLSQQDMKYGGTPLHWACSRAVVDTLVDMNCDIDQVNFEGRTALHVMVIKKRLDCAVALLSRGAKPDIGDIDGNTPLHWAIKMEHLPLIQCLIVFGANLDFVNNQGISPRHLITKEQEHKLLYYLHAVGAKRCPPTMTGCTDGCSYNGTFNGIPPEPVTGPANREPLNQMLSVIGMENASDKNMHQKSKTGRLLCLDGGGIRGLVLIQMLLELEKVIGEPINNCFDWIAGTSTGGILALGIAFGKSMRECLCLYFRMKEQTFVGIRPYASESLENILKDSFGINTIMTDIQHPKVLVTSVLANRKPVELHLFRNYESPTSILGIKHDSPFELPPPPEETHVWHVGRATGAAPTYFRAFGPFLDGGLIANNPTLDALTEIHEYNLALRVRGRENEMCPVTCVVSLGTGLIPVTQLKDIDVFRPESIWDTTKLVMGISSLGTLLVDQATLSDGRVVDRARAWCSMTGIPYFRFSPQMSEDIGMDEKSDEKLCKMCWEAKAYMHANINNLKEVADILLKH